MRQTFWLILIAVGLWSCGKPITEEQIAQVDALMDSAIVAGGIPGGVVCLTADTGIVFLKAYGNRQVVSSHLACETDECYTVVPDTLPMTTNTVFDLASLTKSVATTSAIMCLVRDSALDVNTPVGQFIPAFEKGDSITLAHLLTHTSGLPPYLNVKRLTKRYGEGNRQGLMDSICHCPRWSSAGEKQNYSCLNFITLQRVVEEISGERFDEYCQKHVFEPMGMKDTRFYPLEADATNGISTALSEQETQCMASLLVAPTELLEDSSLLCGAVHDPLARVMNAGISGNAGCFSTAEDLARLAQYLLQHKEDSIVKTFTTVPDSLAFSRRTLGWAAPDSTVRYLGTNPTPLTYGHTGYTGTSMVIVPEQSKALIILTNRVHPYDTHGVNQLRKRIADAVSLNYFASKVQ